jgi:endonuclease/exonuclease/phosphatase family metal-dependent hydrolase
MTSLSLVSLNIEREKHLELVVPFLKKQNADVVCLQELFERDIPQIESALSAKCFFTPSTLYPSEKGLVAEGTGIFTRFPRSDALVEHYAGHEGKLVPFAEGMSPEEKAKTQSYTLAVETVEKDGVSFRVGTTHFVWTPDGETDDIQRAGVENMLAKIHRIGELVLCGDMNAPRGKEIFSRIAETLKDNIPPEYTTSIDGKLHRVGPLPYMVDGLFTTAGYQATDVKLIPGVSDHCAVVATISHV